MKHASDSILQLAQANYLESIESPRDALLAKMEAYAVEHGCPISDPEVAAFLAITTTVARPKRIVEVGTNIGYGAIVLARAAGPGARVQTIEVSPDLCAVARDFVAQAGLTDVIDVIEADAIATLAGMEGPIDLVYIDCIKHDYPRYLELVLPKLSMGALVIADNVLWKGLTAADRVPEDERVRVDALRAFNRTITSHPSLRGVILPLGDGVAYATRIR